MEETKIVQALKGPLSADGYLFVPIVGGSGTGKSHLVRWVADRTQDCANWESRYLAKNDTSIRRVIEIVIEGLEGPAIEAAREALLNAPAKSERKEDLPERLLNELAVIIGKKTVADIAAKDQRSAQMTAKLRHELPAILYDPVVRRGLTAEGAVIPRLIGLALRGRTDDDGLDNDAMRVVDGDLPLALEGIGEANKVAQKLLTQMAASLEIRSAAVRLINEALPAAVKHVFVGDQVDMIAVFGEIRRELRTAGKELVLFIEDLTVLHGVEKEFLDAIVKPARSDDGDLCSLRLLFAITEGHLDGLDTFLTRCDNAYWLDASYDAGGVGKEEAISFLGRYLNACRQDPGDVNDRWANRQNEAWLPNACDACEYQVHCHETFGKSKEGYGLYPFNSTAVDRFVASLSTERFDPRLVVRELVNRFLTMATADLSRGNFPSDELIDQFNEHIDPLDPVVYLKLEADRPGDFRRVVNSMRYWSNPPEHVDDATLAAFGLDPLGDLATVLRSPQSAKPRSTTKGVKAHSGSDKRAARDEPIASQLGAPWASIFDELSRWISNRKTLTHKATNGIRKLVHKSVLENLDFSALPANLGRDFKEQNRFDPNLHLFIAGSVTDQSRSNPVIRIKQDADTAAALQGLILLKKLPDASAYPGADDYRRQAARYLEQWTLSVTARLEQPPEPAAAQAIEGLIVCALVSGMCDEASEPLDYLSALFGGSVSPQRSQRTPKWQDVVKAAGDTYQRLCPLVKAHFGEARGDGNLRAVRADQILGVIREFTKSWPLEAEDKALDRFMRSVKPAVDGEWELLRPRATDAAPFVDSKHPWSEQTGRVLELIEAANRAGRLADYDAARDLKELASVTDQKAHRDLLQAAKLLATDPALIKRIQEVASGRPDSVAAVSKFVTRAKKAMDGVADDLDQRRAGDPKDENLEDVAKDVLAVVAQINIAVADLES